MHRMTPISLPFAAPREARRVAAILAGAIELIWRFGAFSCLFVMVMHSSMWKDLDLRLAVIAAMAAFCFLPRLELASLTFALVVLAIVIDDSASDLEGTLSGELSVHIALGALAVALVASAGVLRILMSEPNEGIFDRDVGALILGWIAAGQVYLFGKASVSANWPSIYPEPAKASAAPLFDGEPALFVSAAWVSVMVAMLVLTILAAWRTTRVRKKAALHSHALTGALVAAVTWMALGNAVGADLGYQWFGATAGLLLGLLAWALFYLLCTESQHMRTWGAVYAIVFGSTSVLGAANAVAIFQGDLVGVVGLGLMAGMTWALSRFVWARWRGVPHLIRRAHEQATQVQELLQKHVACGPDDHEPACLTPQEVDDALLEIKRVRTVHAAATGIDFTRVAIEGTPEWRASDIPDLGWLRVAATAGRWQVFRDSPLLHGSALAEVRAANDALAHVRATLLASAQARSACSAVTDH